MSRSMVCNVDLMMDMIMSLKLRGSALGRKLGLRRGIEMVTSIPVVKLVYILNRPLSIPCLACELLKQHS